MKMNQCSKGMDLLQNRMNIYINRISIHKNRMIIDTHGINNLPIRHNYLSFLNFSLPNKNVALSIHSKSISYFCIKLSSPSICSSYFIEYLYLDGHYFVLPIFHISLQAVNLSILPLDRCQKIRYCISLRCLIKVVEVKRCLILKILDNG